MTNDQSRFPEPFSTRMMPIGRSPIPSIHAHRSNDASKDENDTSIGESSTSMDNANPLRSTKKRHTMRIKIRLPVEGTMNRDTIRRRTGTHRDPHRPGLEGKDLKSSVSNTYSRLGHGAAPEDRSHVLEMIRAWGGGRGDETGKGNGIDSDATAAMSERGDLIERLARANTKRRERIMYWSEHPDQTSFLDAVPAVPGALARGSDLSRTQYATASRIPDVPREVELHRFFNCPYCLLRLDSATMRDDREAWKRHVLRDLHPYVCTSPSCPSGDKLYATREDWIHHEMQLHRRQWTCPCCPLTLVSREKMTSHVASNHGDVHDVENLRAILDLHERPLDEAASSQCPLCPFSANTNRVLNHVAEHMEQLSLFALCPLGDDQGNRDVPRVQNTARVDETERPRPCKCRFMFCRDTFERHDDLTMHYRTIHYGEKSYACQFPGCDKKFTRTHALARHSEEHSSSGPFWL
ncbi:hypothetical protein QBC34DRAFT_415409 [Podospora aff. communis PSN243]|uniref:C2H2-type domain-containing protein n=1 Tax=Podospora aff. communis PSN243 TaxID=3040156 RepID=A0AAV9G872_9PEZI|nr:hypothetical protein QBC34DRAFT_415409 [Podospora aff. communis PSN243]